jgi:hypothetical protein
VKKPSFMALLIGPPEHGKTSAAAELAEQRLVAGSFVLAQDPDREFGRFCVRYASAEEFLVAVAAAAKQGRTLAGGASFRTISPDKLLALAVELGELWNRGDEDAGVRQPICIVVNEVSEFEESGSTHIGKGLYAALSQRRHLGLEPIFAMQDPTQLPAKVFGYATEIHLFRHSRHDVVLELERRLGREKGDLVALLDLPAHQRAIWRPVVGFQS